VVAQGWNVDCWPVLALLRVSTPVHLRVGLPSGGDGTRGGCGGRSGTLLGPEGTGAGCVSFLLRAASSVEPSAALVVVSLGVSPGRRPGCGG
jgi:hypothetical protein